MTTARELTERGLFATPRAVAAITESFGLPGTFAAERLLTARLFDSVEFEVLPGRGFDIGAAWFRGMPVSWFSPVDDARALSAPSGVEWLTRFTGGLLTTCGFDNIGASTARGGMHGTANHLAADEVSWRIGEPSSADALELSATVRSASLFGPSFQVRRAITVSAAADGGATIRVRDDVTNVGPEPAPLSLLYHLNLGAPLVVPGTTVEVDSTGVTASGPHPEVPEWHTLPEPSDHLAEAVFLHDSVAIDADGFSSANIADPGGRLVVTIAWSAATLPLLHQWVFPTRGRWALGIEPANAPLFGADRDDPGAGSPVLAPGETRTHEVRVTIAAGRAGRL